MLLRIAIHSTVIMVPYCWLAWEYIIPKSDLGIIIIFIPQLGICYFLKDQFLTYYCYYFDYVTFLPQVYIEMEVPMSNAHLSELALWKSTWESRSPGLSVP